MSKIKTATAVVAATAATIGAVSVPTMVQADELEPNTVQAEQSATQEVVTQDDVNNAQTAVDEAQSVADQSDTAVEEAEQEVVQAEEDIKQAQDDMQDAQQAQEEATPEAGAEAEDDIKAAEEVVVIVEEEHKEAEAVAEDVAKEQAEAQAVADKAQAASDKADKDAQEAQANADKAQAEKDHAQSQVTEGEKVVEQEKDAVNKGEQAVKDAEDKVEAAEGQDKADEKAVEEAKKAVDTAKTNQANKEKDVTNAQNKVNDQQKVVDKSAEATKKAKDALDSKAELKAPTSLELSKGWLNAFSDLQAAKGTSNETAKRNALKAVSTAEYQRVNQIFAQKSDLDRTAKYDINNLSQSLVNELNNYATALVNSVNNALGNGKTVKANTNIITFAKDVATEYQKHQNGMGNGHDIPAIAAAAKKNGLAGTTYNPYENLSVSVSYNSLMSEHDLYRFVYSSLAAMFPGDSASNFGHALSLVGMDTLGISFNGYLDTKDTTGIPGARIIEMHILNVPNASYVMKSGTAAQVTAEYNKLYGASSTANLKPSAVDSSAQQAAYNQAVSTETKARNDLKTFTTALNNAEIALATAKTNVTKAQAHYDDVVKTSSPSAQAKIELANAKTTLANAKVRLSNAEASLKAARELLSTKTSALDTAKTKLVSAKEKQVATKAPLETAKASLALANENAVLANNALAKAKEQLDVAHQALSIAQAVRDRLVNAGANYEKAQQAYEDALQRQTDAEAAYNVAVANAEVAHQSLKDAQAHYNTVYSQFLVQQTIDDLNKKDESDDTIKDDIKDVVNDIGGTAVVHADEITKDDKQATDTSAKSIESVDKATPVNTAAVLPKAGSTDSPYLGILGVMLVAIAGFFGFRRKKHAE